MMACLVAGCGTSFKYDPKYGQTYPAISDRRGLEIAGGVDERPPAEKRPEWSRSVEGIVARALADEVKHAGLFQRVRIHLAGPARLDKFSYYVEFRVKAFQMFPQIGGMEKAGRTALGALGWRGALISASIPKTWESQVTVEFEVFDAAKQKRVFGQTYTESRSLKANGYQGDSRQIEQTSDCLEAVVQRFVGDFTRIASSLSG